VFVSLEALSSALQPEQAQEHLRGGAGSWDACPTPVARMGLHSNLELAAPCDQP